MSGPALLLGINGPWEVLISCTPPTNSAESPGVLLFSTAYEGLDNESVSAAFGGAGAQVYDGQYILLSDACDPQVLGG